MQASNIVPLAYCRGIYRATSNLICIWVNGDYKAKFNFLSLLLRPSYFVYHNTVEGVLVCVLSAMQMQDKDPILISTML